MIKEVNNYESSNQTDNQNPILRDTGFSFSQVFSKAISLTKNSESYTALYEPMMKNVSIMSRSEVKQKLNFCGIEYEDTEIQNEFQKSCIKTDWQSTVYRIKYGKFKTILKLIRVNFASNVICRSFHGRGSFGEIWKFDSYAGKKQYALKNIIIKNSESDSIDVALREVFMAKLFSALEIGPKFSQLFQYDAILFDRSLQYAMEFCVTNYTINQFQKQLKQKQLLKNLKLIHSLNICHKDIKYLNIAWSQTFNKFIFLDYNFTQIVKEPLGYKTLTKFIGTYNYASPEMMKCYNLKQKLFVDLYYNDLFCLMVTWKQMNEQKENKKKYPLFDQYLVQKQPKPLQFLDVKLQNLKNDGTIKIIFNNCLLEYFQMKMSVFNNHIQKIIRLIQKNRYLSECFKRIIYNYSIEGNTDNQINLERKNFYLICCEKMNRKTDQIPVELLQLDSVLSAGEMKNINQINRTNLFTKIIQISESEELFSQLWNYQTWKENIFFFVDVYSNSSQHSTKYRKKLINNICKHILKQQNIRNMSATLKFREVLLYYFAYFQQKNNFEILQKILGYFVLMDDENNCDRMQNIILKQFQGEKKYCQYLNMNFMMFLGQSVLTYKNHTINTNKFIANLQKLIKQVESDLDSPKDLLRHIKATIQTMLNFKKVRFYYCRLFNPSQLNQKLKIYLNSSRYYLNKDIITVIQKILINRYFQDCSKIGDVQISSTQYLKIQHIFLEKYIFKMKIYCTHKALTSKPIALLLKSQEFTKQFPLILHNTIFSQISSETKKEIFADYCVLGKNEKSFCNLNYVQACLNEQLQNSYLNQLNVFSIEGIKNIQDFIDLQVGLMCFMTRIICLKNRLGYKYSEKMVEKICETFTLFHEFSTYVSRTQACFFCGQPVLKDQIKQQTQQLGSQTSTGEISLLPKCETMFENQRKYLYLLFCQFMGRTDRSIDILLQMLAQRQNNMLKKSLLIYFFCKINGNFTQQVKKKLESTLLKIIQTQIFPKFELLFIVEQLFQKIMQIYAQKILYDEAIEISRQFCAKMYSRQLPIIIPHFISGVKSFVQLIRSPYQLKHWLQKEALNTLKSFNKYPIFTFFIGSVYLQLRVNRIDISNQVRKRLLIISIFYIGVFHQGLFRNYKVMLFKQARKFRIYSLKKQALNERRFGLAKKYMIFLQRKIDSNRQKRQNNLLRKLRYFELLDKIRLKICSYEQNRSQKLKVN